MLRNIPNAAGLNKCFLLKRIRCFELTARNEANRNIHQGLSEERTYPIIKPEIIELSVITGLCSLKNNITDSTHTAEITAMKVVNKNIASLSLKDK